MNRPETRPGDPDARTDALRAEIDRLRLENQRLAADLEDARHVGRSLAGLPLRLWRGAWQAYYVARWKVLHARDPRQAFRARDRHDPRPVAVLHPPLGVRPRVLHVIGNFHTGGSAQLVVDLIERLGHRYAQAVLVRSLPPLPAYTGVELVHVERIRRDGQVRSLLKRIRPDLVHVHMLGHRHDEYGQRDWRWYHRVFRGLEAYGCPVIENLNIPVEPYVSPSVGCYVHVSDHVRELFARAVAWNETIYPGSDLDLFARAPDQPVPDDCIGMVYRLQPDKLDERSIEPFIAAVRMRPGTKAHIVGGGQFLETYRRRVAQEGMQDAFTFTGFVPYAELPAHLARMSIFVAPVHTESFGQVSPFAMGMSLPVAGYRVGALEEITGAPALLAAPGDADALARILVGLLDDRARRLRIGEQNRLRARERFSVEAMVERYASLYDEFVARPRVRRSRAPASAVPSPALTALAAPPDVTVLMAVHDGERHLREAITSILDQSHANFELVLIDDGSTDRSRAIAASYRDPRIRILENDRNLGLAASLNRGLAVARGRYIARLDADDVAEPDRLSRQVSFLDRHADVALLGSWYTIVDDHGRRIGRRWVPCDHHEIRWTLMFCNAFAHSAVMIRRAVLEEFGGYDESLVYAMDYDLWLRIAARRRVANLDAFLLHWRASTTSMTARLGDATERIDRVATDLATRLGWPAGDVAENERRAALLAGFISQATPDASPEEAEWAVRTLFELHEDFSREHALEPGIRDALRAELVRQCSRCLCWMGHLYPDRRDHAYARRMLLAAIRLQPASLLTRHGAGLVFKLVSGRRGVSAVRWLAGRVGAGQAKGVLLPPSSSLS